MVRLSDKIAEVFYPVHRAIRDETHDEFKLKDKKVKTPEEDQGDVFPV